MRLLVTTLFQGELSHDLLSSSFRSIQLVQADKDFSLYLVVVFR